MSFEPNANYDLEIAIRKNRGRGGARLHGWWTVAIRFVFPHMNYKRKVIQLDLWGKSTVNAAEVRMPHRALPTSMRRGFAAVLDLCQEPLTAYA
jgi:hypothetical protein